MISKEIVKQYKITRRGLSVQQVAMLRLLWSPLITDEERQQIREGKTSIGQTLRKIAIRRHEQN